MTLPRAQIPSGDPASPCGNTLVRRPARLWRWVAVVGIGLAISLIPRPSGVSPDAWHLLAIFVATVAGLTGRPAEDHGHPSYRPPRGGITLGQAAGLADLVAPEP